MPSLPLPLLRWAPLLAHCMAGAHDSTQALCRDCKPRAACGREGDSIIEHPLRVHVELIYGHNVDKPARDTSNYMRKCMPYPFKGEVALQSPGADFHLRLQGFRKVIAYAAGAAVPTRRPDPEPDLAAGHSLPTASKQCALRSCGPCCLSLQGTC